MTQVWINQGGVWRQVNRKIDMALENRKAALAALKTAKATPNSAKGKLSTSDQNMMALIAIKSSLEAGLGDVSLKDSLI